MELQRQGGVLTPLTSGLRVPEIPIHVTHAFYRAYVFLRPEALKTDWSQHRIIEEINKRGVPVYHGSAPEIYLEKAFDNSTSRPSARLPVAKALGETSLMFLVHPTLTDAEIAKTCEVLTEVMSEAQR